MCLITGGCAGPPAFDTPGDITVAQIVDHVVCEARQAWASHSPDPNHFKNWVAVANLYLQVDDSGSIAPTLTYINPLAMMTSFMFGGTATLQDTRQRIYTQNLTVQLVPVPNDPTAARCEKPQEKEFNPYNLTGDIGIQEVVDKAFTTMSSDSKMTPGSPQTSTAFGESLQFVLVKSLTAVGPTWTLKHFKGPGGFLNTSRTDTHKLIISFAPPSTSAQTLAAITLTPSIISPQGGPVILPQLSPDIANQVDVASATATASSNNFNMLFQGTLSTLRPGP
jgi:hypothetical protein